MTPAQFHNSALDILRNYWRIKAANALYAQSPQVAEETLEYTNLPAVGMVANLLTTEPGADAMSALQDFVLCRLPRDLLLALIAEFESRLVFRLSTLGASTTGTLGTLQTRIQHRLSPATHLIQDLNEIRERRNVMIHDGDIAGPVYVAAAALVLPRAAPYVSPAAVGHRITTTDAYLTYAADVLVRYSDAIG
jgi:hypothetical protein